MIFLSFWSDAFRIDWLTCFFCCIGLLNWLISYLSLLCVFSIFQHLLNRLRLQPICEIRHRTWECVLFVPLITFEPQPKLERLGLVFVVNLFHKSSSIKIAFTFLNLTPLQSVQKNRVYKLGKICCIVGWKYHKILKFKETHDNWMKHAHTHVTRVNRPDWLGKRACKEFLKARQGH